MKNSTRIESPTADWLRSTGVPESEIESRLMEMGCLPSQVDARFQRQVSTLEKSLNASDATGLAVLRHLKKRVGGAA